VKQPKITVVDGMGFDEIVDALVNEELGAIRRHRLSQKMATKLHREVWLRVEAVRPFREDPETYIMERLEEQVKKYVASGFHDAIGYSEEGFRSALCSLVAKTVKSFAPPATYPIVDGEFTVLLVIPPEWISLRRQIASLTSSDGGGVPSLPFETAEYGKPAPKEPYVLVGLNGGRGLKDCTFLQANAEVKRGGCTYLSTHQLTQLLIVRPRFLAPQAESIALGDRSIEANVVSGETHVVFTGNQNDYPTLSTKRIQAPRMGVGVGKPYYSAMITV